MTLLIVGHTHEYDHYADDKEIIVGFGAEMHGLDGVRFVSDLGDAVAIAMAVASPSPSCDQRQPARSGDLSEATTFFVSSTDDAENLARLVALANGEAEEEPPEVPEAA